MYDTVCYSQQALLSFLSSFFLENLSSLETLLKLPHSPPA
jgi:hypothetical protein